MDKHHRNPGNTAPAQAHSAKPEPVLTVRAAIGLTVGIVIGAGIFRLPSIVAGNASSESVVLLAWMLGGAVSLVGALVYAELATTYPNAGGEYHFLSRAFGPSVGFLFSWARLSVIQTGSIAALGFVFGDYAEKILSLGPYSSTIYAALLVMALTTLNIIGVKEEARVQNVLTSIEVLGVVTVIVAGLFFVTPFSELGAAAPQSTAPATSSLGLMMVFVLFTYGGWNEAVYASAELKDVRRNMVRVLVFSLVLLTGLYVLANVAYLRALGLVGTATSNGVAAEVMRRAAGDWGVGLISVLVAVSSLTTANASIFTGGRSSYAFGRDVPRFRYLGQWNAHTGTPVNALIVQGAATLALVLIGGITRQGLQTMVDYTAPVFWLFFLLTGASVFVLRRKDAGIERPFRVPAYPVTPIIFCLTCAYLLYSSLAYVRTGALAGVAVLLVGVILLAMQRRN